MSDNQQSNNDPNLALAQQIGQARAASQPLEKLDDVLMDPLLKHRRRVRQQAVNQTEKERVWQQIAQTTTSSESQTPIYQLFSAQTYRWAAVAILLISVLVGVLYTQFWSQPKLLAQSGASIEVVQLNDGSSVTLRPHSKLFKVDQSASLLLYKLKGEALFKVTDKTARTFSVKTANGRVSVLGTQFILSSWGARMQVFLQEGSVKVQAKQHNNTLTLQPDQAAVVTANGHISRLQNPQAVAFTDWLNQQLVFNSKPAKLVVRELEQQFDITISLPKDIANNRLSGQLSLQNLDVALNDLSLVLGGTFVQTEEQHFQFKQK